MSTPTLTPVSEDYGEVSSNAFVLVNDPAWAILLPNGRLYREPHAWYQAPDSTQPTVWFTEEAAETQRTLEALMLEVRYGIDPEHPQTALWVVRVEMGTDGIWRIPEPDPAQRGYRPLDLDTEELAELPCDSAADLDVDTARRVVRQHKECAGRITCRVRGRARQVLARAGVWKLNRHPAVWQSLDLPDMAR